MKRLSQNRLSQLRKLSGAQKLIIIMAIIMLIVNGTLANIIQNMMWTNLTATEHKYLAEIVKNIGNISEQTVHEYVAICDVLAKNHAIIDVLKESTTENPMNVHESAWRVSEELSSIMESYGGKIMSMAIFDIETDAML